MVPTISELPHELILIIGNNMRLRDCMRFYNTCKRFYDLSGACAQIAHCRKMYKCFNVIDTINYDIRVAFSQKRLFSKQIYVSRRIINRKDTIFSDSSDINDTVYNILKIIDNIPFVSDNNVPYYGQSHQFYQAVELTNDSIEHLLFNSTNKLSFITF